MGSLAEGGDDGVEPMKETPSPNSAPTHTQPFSSLPGEDFGVASGWHCAQSTMPYDDNVPLEDALETQVVNFCCETQVLDDRDFFENMETQLIEDFNVESDGEATDKTEVLGGGDELSDGESGRGGKCASLDGEKAQHTPCKFGDKALLGQTNPLTDEQHSPRSVPRFTSVRAASLRASGLAAQRIASKGTDCNSCSLLDNVQFSEDNNIKLDGSEIKDWGDKGSCHDDLSGPIGGKKCEVGCSTVRKLFTEDSYVENEVLPYNDDKGVGGKEALQFPTYQDGSAGLSYVDSQEPGEFSQANALACVQRLIDESKVLFENELDYGKCRKGNSKCISSAKGPQSLAKKANDRGTVEKSRVFDWDDEREDEGGGDIFCRKKEEFFHGEHSAQRPFTELQKHRKTQPNRYRYNEGKSNVQSEKLVHSDSRLLHNLKGNDKKAQETGINVRRNLVCEFNEQSKVDASAGQLENALSRKDMLNVGLDTQLAAEAMEALFHGEGVANYDANDDQLGVQSKEGYENVSARRKTKKSARSGQCSYDRSNHVGVATRNSKKPRELGVKSSKQSSVSAQKHLEDVRKRSATGIVMTRSKRAKIDAEKLSTTYGSTKEPRKLGGATEDCRCDEDNTLQGNALKAGSSVKKRRLPDELAAFTPTGRRRRQPLAVSQLKSVYNVLSNAKEMASLLSGELENHKENLTRSNGIRCSKGRRSCRNSSRQRKEFDNLDCQPKRSSQFGNIGKSFTGNKRSEGNARTEIADSNKKRKTECSSPASLYMLSTQRNSGEQLQQGVGNLCPNAGNTGYKLNENLAKAMTLADKRNGADCSLSAENEENPRLDKSPEDATKSFESACTSPANCKTPVNAASPVCVGNGYSELSCKRNLSRSSLMRELSSLCATGLEPISPAKDLRKRRDLASIRVLFSQHLDDDTLKHQRKIVDRLKISVASYIMEATHFISDKFVRTRNMLEAIASGKPVVTHLWLENVGRANYYIDEEKYTLRDTKKEKEFGFNLAVSLAHARQHPLLQGKRVLITPNAKPGKETILSLVKAVHGKAVQRVGKSALRDDKVPDDLLVLSCEEDYEACVPFLERGAAVYSSELLLNGIVIQKLEYERHQLFVDQVRRTRSTVWLKKDGCGFKPVPKLK